MINISKLPEKPQFRMDNLDNYPTFNAMAIKFHDWFDHVLVPWHASLFKDAVEVYGRKIENQWGGTEREIYWGDGGTSIHKALLINIQPIKEETAEDILREWLMATPSKQDGSYDKINQPQAYKAWHHFEKIK